jgi:hypothetical protein
MLRKAAYASCQPVAADGTFVATGVPDDGGMHPINFMVYDNARSPEPIRNRLAPGEVTIDVPFRAKD